MASWGKGQFLAITILLAVLFGACKEKKEIPEGILPPEEMTHVMINIHLLETKLGRLNVRTDSAKVLFRYFEGLLLQENGIDTATYRKSMDFYTVEPKLFKRVYTAVVDSLLEMESVEKLREEEINRREEEEIKEAKALIDSVKHAKDSIANLPDSIRMDLDSAIQVSDSLQAVDSVKKVYDFKVIKKDSLPVKRMPKIMRQKRNFKRQ